MHTIDRRIGLLFGGFLLLLAIAGLRATYLGVFRSGELSSFAASQAVTQKTVPPLRGMITDRDGQVMAISESADDLIADPYLIKHPHAVAATLAPLLDVPAATLEQSLAKPNTGYVVFARNVPSSVTAQIMALHIDGISQPTAVQRRIDPLGTTAGQVLGWIDARNRGVAGVEMELNHRLAGHPGRTRIVAAGDQQAIGVSTVTPVQDGARVALTLSVPLQHQVERALAQTAAIYHPTSETAIVTDPQTGQVLADANWPFVNPDDLGATPPANTTDDSVQLAYEPGSTFKAFTVAGGLMDGTITPDTRIDVPPTLSIYGKTIADAEPHGYVSYSVAQVLKYSSNIGADLIAQRDGPEHGAIRFDHWMHRFGFGRRTGVELNGESDGIVPTLASYSGLSMYNLPFGQGEEVTPMQMVQAYDAIADGGILRTPQLIRSVNGHPVATSRGTRILTPQVAQELRAMMRGVLADGGTASGAAIPGYDLAGKTGTAQMVVHSQYSNNLFNASFIGMVPASAPKLLVAVIVSGVDSYGGTVAGPAFQKIVGWAVPHFGINPCPAPCPTTAYAGASPSTP